MIVICQRPTWTEQSAFDAFDISIKFVIVIVDGSFFVNDFYFLLGGIPYSFVFYETLQSILWCKRFNYRLWPYIHSFIHLCSFSSYLNLFIKLFRFKLHQLWIVWFCSRIEQPAGAQWLLVQLWIYIFQLNRWN